MPYIIGQFISQDLEGLWGEGKPYQREKIYSIEGDGPSVNYEKHILKSHSLTHIETPLHTQEKGKSIDYYFQNNNFFWGKACVIRLKGNKYKKIDNTNSLWEVSLKELKDALDENNIDSNNIEKILITSDTYPIDKFGYHDPTKVLILSFEAAEYLTTLSKFNLYGTSWKSTDFQPGKSIRPIHNKIFENAVILECLNLKDVPSGEYFLNCIPLPIIGASESPTCPVLFTKNELKI